LKHEAIIDFMLKNPAMQHQAIAAHFGVTSSYFSVLTNSDMFKAKLRERRCGMENLLDITMKDRIQGTAIMALEKLGVMLEVSLDPRFILDSTDKLLHRAGYAPQAKVAPIAAVQNNNFYILDKKDLAELRPNMAVSQSQGPALPSPNEIVQEPEPAAQPLEIEYEEIEVAMPTS